MDVKRCFKCQEIKTLTEFYAHKKMADGHLNKCKTCAKRDVSKLYEENIENEDYVEKERLRGRVKYAKYKYKNKIQHPENRATARHLKKNGIDLTGVEVHHWNYHLKNDIFILNPRAHKLVHKHITFDKESNMFKYKDVLMDTKEKHFAVIESIFKKSNVNYEIDSYTDIIAKRRINS